MSYTSQNLRAILQSLPPTQCYWVAYSGGCDSQVLLHSLASLELPHIKVKAIHVDHGLQSQSAAWGDQCQTWARDLGIECRVVKVDASAEKGESPEEAARRARYQALTEVMETGDVLLTAHHCDDQAETVLLQMLRGSGALGLSAMAQTMPLAQGSLCRPLLEFRRADLEAYARQQGLSWIDDPSNEAVHFDRNYLRHEITPRLAQRWSSWQHVLRRAASHQADMQRLADDLAQIDYQSSLVEGSSLLRVGEVLRLPEYRQRNLLRYWIRKLNLPLPTSQQLEHILNDVLLADADKMPVVKWSGAEVRRYKNALYAMAPLPQHDARWNCSWDTQNQSSVSTPTGELSYQHLIELGMTEDEITAAPLQIRYRCGGEKIQFRGKTFHRDLKSLLQEASVPPWLRDRIPLIYRKDRLVAVIGYWLGD